MRWVELQRCSSQGGLTRAVAGWSDTRSLAVYLSVQARKYIPDSFSLVELFGCVVEAGAATCTGHCCLRQTGTERHALQRVCVPKVDSPVPADCRAHRYTLGGFYLARYDDSPAGVFDELVVMAGLVWNPPTSCAWAARVFVNSK